MLDWRSHWGSSHPGYRRASDWWTLSQTDSRRQPIAAKTEERTRRWGSTATRARLKQERLRFPKRRTSCSFPLEYSPEKAWREAPLSEPATPPSWCVGRRYDSMAQPRTKRNEQMEYACSASIDKHWVVHGRAGATHHRHPAAYSHLHLCSVSCSRSQARWSVSL